MTGNAMTLIDLGVACGAIMSVIGLGVWINRAIKKMMEPINQLNTVVQGLKEASRASLKYSITRAHKEYLMANKISRYAKNCILDMNKQYKALDGNEFVGSMINDIDRLELTDL